MPSREFTRAGITTARLSYLIRFGLGTSSPPQLGHTFFMARAQDSQKVHS